MRPIKILVVEDDVFLGKGLVKKLEKTGYTITDFVNNKEEAIRSFENNIPDLVIVDIELEKAGSRAKDIDGGITFVNTISSKYNTPCIYYTGHGNDENLIGKAQASNHTGIVIKTAPFLQVKLTIQSILQKFWEAEKINSLPTFFFIEGTKKFRGREQKIVHRVESKDIVWVEYANNSVQIFSKDNTNELRKKNLQLSTFLKRYPYPFLLQISQNIIINKDRILNILPETDEIIMLHNNEEVYHSVTTTYRKAFMQFINQRKIKSQ